MDGSLRYLYVRPGPSVMFMLSKSEAAVYLLLYQVNGSLPQRFCSPKTVSAMAVPPVAPGYLQIAETVSV